MHADSKGYTSANMILRRAQSSVSNGNKIDTCSSTKDKLIQGGDAPQILWSLYLKQAQGHGMMHAVLYQDYKSTILLETNGNSPAVDKPSIPR